MLPFAISTPQVHPSSNNSSTAATPAAAASLISVQDALKLCPAALVFLLVVMQGVYALLAFAHGMPGLRSFRTPGSTQPTVTAVAGVFITKRTAAETLNACRDSVRAFNSQQNKVHVTLLFYIGQPGHPLQQQQPNSTSDIVQDNFRENMNHGKTFEGFKYVSENYQHSDVALKMDTDTAANWTRLQPFLEDMPRTSLGLLAAAYLGRTNTYEICGNLSSCPPAGCTTMDGACWTYMSGALYGVSLPIAAAITHDCDWAAAHKRGHEDLMIGRMIKHCWVDKGRPLKLVHITEGVEYLHGDSVNATTIRMAG